jgi:hypothetical protein
LRLSWTQPARDGDADECDQEKMGPVRDHGVW